MISPYQIITKPIQAIKEKNMTIQILSERL